MQNAENKKTPRRLSYTPPSPQYYEIYLQELNMVPTVNIREK